MKLLGKIIIDGNIETLTGMAIGGSDKDMMIGGIDASILKDSKGIPFIPGSSIKGKLRSLLELSKGRENICECGYCDICTIFGVSANKRKDRTGPTRVLIRDSYLSDKTREKMENKEGIFEHLEMLYTESKVENSIDRLTSRANPRTLERVPAGSEFEFNIIFNIFEEDDLNRFIVFLGTMNMLEDDYLGGHGSRGYGQIRFKNINVRSKSSLDYLKGKNGRTIDENILGIKNLVAKEEIIRTLENYLLLGDE